MPSVGLSCPCRLIGFLIAVIPKALFQAVGPLAADSKGSTTQRTYSRLNLRSRSGLPLLLLLLASLSRRCLTSSSSGTSSSSSPSSESYPLSDPGPPATTSRSCSLSRQVEGTSHLAIWFCTLARTVWVPLEMVSSGRYAPYRLLRVRCHSG